MGSDDEVGPARIGEDFRDCLHGGINPRDQLVVRFVGEGQGNLFLG